MVAAVVAIFVLVTLARGFRRQPRDYQRIARQRLEIILRLQKAFRINDGHLVEEQIREDRRPFVAQIFRPDLSWIGYRVKRCCWRLSSALDRCVAADAVQLPIFLIDGIEIAIVAGGRHAAADRAVCERYQIDAEELRSALNLAFDTIPVPGLRGIA